MDYELLYGLKENQAHCCYLPIYLSMFLTFLDKFVSYFSQELVKLNASYLVYR